MLNNSCRAHHLQHHLLHTESGGGPNSTLACFPISRSVSLHVKRAAISENRQSASPECESCKCIRNAPIARAALANAGVGYGVEVMVRRAGNSQNEGKTLFRDTRLPRCHCALLSGIPTTSCAMAPSSYYANVLCIELSSSPG